MTLLPPRRKVFKHPSGGMLIEDNSLSEKDIEKLNDLNSFLSNLKRHEKRNVKIDELREKLNWSDEKEEEYQKAIADVNEGEIIKNVIANKISHIEHHRCAICNMMTRYDVIYNPTNNSIKLFFDGNCGCAAIASLQPREWSDIVNWVNDQSNPAVKVFIKMRIGFSIPNHVRKFFNLY